MLYNDEKLTFRVLNAGVFKHKNGCFNVDARNCSALSYRSCGSAIFTVDGESYSVKTGDIVFIPADTPYSVCYYDSESIVVHLDCCSYDKVDKIVVNDKRKLLSHFIRIYEDYKGGVSQNHLKSLTFAILSAIEEDRMGSAYNSEMAACIKYIDDHFRDHTLAVEDVCRDNYISRSSLQRAFHSQFGMSPRSYIIKRRLKSSVELLLSGGVSCSEAAYLSGFSDEKYFSRVFKKHYSVSPSKFSGK